MLTRRWEVRPAAFSPVCGVTAKHSMTPSELPTGSSTRAASAGTNRAYCPYTRKETKDSVSTAGPFSKPPSSLSPGDLEYSDMHPTAGLSPLFSPRRLPISQPNYSIPCVRSPHRPTTHYFSPFPTHFGLLPYLLSSSPIFQPSPASFNLLHHLSSPILRIPRHIQPLPVTQNVRTFSSFATPSIASIASIPPIPPIHSVPSTLRPFDPSTPPTFLPVDIFNQRAKFSPSVFAWTETGDSF
jgi:hypothetical protein